MLRPSFSYIKLFLLNIILAFCIIPKDVSGQEYRVSVKDLLNNGRVVGVVDSALVTLGDSTKYTDKNGIAIFYNPVVGVEDNYIPVSFKVSDAYPNPAKDKPVKFDFETDDNSVNIEVYNILGEKVGEYNGNIAQGVNTIKIDGLNELPNGVYLTRITSGNNSEVRKFINMNNGSNENLSISVIPSTHALAKSTKDEKDTYIKFHVEKEGYNPIDMNIDPSQTDIQVELTRDGYTLGGYIIDIDNPDSTLDGIVRAYYNGDSVTVATDNKYFEMIIPVPVLDSLKASKNDSSFASTFTDVDISQNITNAGLPVVTYDSLRANDVPDTTFYKFVKEVATKRYHPNGGYTGKSHIVSIDFPNASKGYENGGYTYWIDRDFMYNSEPSSYDSLSVEQQEFIKDIIINHFYDDMQDSTHMPKFYLAQPGERPPLRSSGGVARGILFITHMRGGNGYGYSEKFYDSDWTVDASHIYIGDPPDIVANIIQETASIIAPITGSQMDEMGGKSVFSEADPTGDLTPTDHTLLHIEENIHHNGEELIMDYTLPNGEIIKRFYFPDGVDINHVLGKRQ